VHGVSRRAPGVDTIDVHLADLGDRAAVHTLIENIRPDTVLHLAGSVTGGRAVEAGIPAFDVTLGSTVYLLEALAKVPVSRLVVAGALEEPLHHDDPPSSPYAVAKEAGRLWTRLAFAHWGVPAVWARLFMVYGPGQQDWNKLVPATCRALLSGEAV